MSSDAMKFLMEAAQNGNADAQFKLAASYGKGEGVEKDPVKAVYWCTKAAEQGDPSAQHNLAICYDLGDGIEQDYNKAVYWYRKAAEQGFKEPQFKLAQHYENGLGVERNYEEALFWYRKAADLGHAGAIAKLNTSKNSRKTTSGETKKRSVLYYIFRVVTFPFWLIWQLIKVLIDLI